MARDRIVQAYLAAVAGVVPATAWAQAEDMATARALFNDARALMAKGDYGLACPKLEAASKLYAGSGVLLNLGDCYEHVGRTASAWTEFGEAASAADRARRPEDKAEAVERQAALEPRLSKLLIRVGSSIPGLALKRDGTLLDQGAWGVAVPVDPGAHTVSAESTGRVPWSSSANVTEAGKTITVEVPELVSLPTPPAEPPTAPPASTVVPTAKAASPTLPHAYWTGRRFAGTVLTGAGTIGVGAAGVLALASQSAFKTAQRELGAQRHDDSATSVALADAATVAVLAGAAIAASGVVVWLTASSANTQVGSNGAALFVRGTF